MLVHNVTSGPYESRTEYNQWYLVVLVEEDGKLSDTELFFDDLDSAYHFSNHFKTSIDPIDLTTDSQWMKGIN